MRLIEALTHCTETEANATAFFAPDHFAVEGCKVIQSALIECVAQTAAAALGYRKAARSNVTFPLTPTLSPGERENASQIHGHAEE